jgi:anhydro-N-acetylmuramic acid kinase
MENYAIAIEDKMTTFTEHVGLQTGLALPNSKGKMLITGGGAYNDFLIARMQHYIPNLDLIIPDAKTLEYKEALIFALLGVLKLRGEINVLHSVTGARNDHSSGVVY